MDNDTISEYFIKYTENKALFDDVLAASLPLFRSFSYSTYDSAECISRMSRNLYKLVTYYDEKRGTPMQLVYKMCKNVVIDMHREQKRKSHIEYVEDSRYIMDTDKQYASEEYEICQREDYDEIKEKLLDIINNSNLRGSQKEKYDRGEIQPIKHIKNLNEIKDKILKDKLLSDYILRKYKYRG